MFVPNNTGANINTPGVAAPKKKVILKGFMSLLMLILSYVLGNKLFYVFGFLIKQIM